MEQEKCNCIYILKCGDGSLYTGWTDNLPKRLAAHRAGKGAKYTKGRLPLELLYTEAFPTRQQAMQREYAIKKLSHAQKLLLAAAAARLFADDE